MIVEVENFLDDPEYVLEKFFASNFKKCSFFTSKEIYSGFRAFCDDEHINNEIRLKVEKILNTKVINISITFNINNRMSVFGAPHVDDDGMTRNGVSSKKYSGVVYLNKSAPKDAGTTLYDGFNYPHEYRSKIQILYSQEIPPNNFFKQFIKREILEEKLKSKVIHKFDNRYNHMVMYDSSIIHSPDNYFGYTIKDSRHTIAFFATT